MASARKGKLDAYRAKRTADATPEPMGGASDNAAAPGGGGTFVVQKHAARRTHYDLRLEIDGVLRSWAVPKGPSADPAEKRLAVETEDHPLEYADFEGVIPAGEYGAGAMIVWDRGRWAPVGEPPEEQLAAGKLLFELSGYKLHGLWALVKLKKSDSGKDWLLLKERDGFVSTRPYPEESVLSGLSCEELAAGSSRAADLRAELERLGAPRRPVVLRDVDFMLAETRDGPFDAPGWLFEIKYDGFRLLAAREADRPVLQFRGRGEASDTFPEITAAVGRLPATQFILDGEVAVHDDQGRPSFQRLQKRALFGRSSDAARAAVESPATLYVFDLLAFEGFDLRPLPLLERKRLLARFLPRAGPVRFADHIEERGAAFFAGVERMGLEGMVAKKADSPYKAGRSSLWQKVRIERTGDFAVVGWTEPTKRSRTGFGALHVAQRAADGSLVYAGKVGTGFTESQLAEVRADLEADRCPKPPCGGATPGGKEHRWVAPRLVCEVRYKEITEEGLLRQPLFLRFRRDKTVAEVESRSPAEKCPVTSDQRPVTRENPVVPPRRDLRLSNLDKVFWPAEKYTKGDLIEYYRAIAPWLLPYLRSRPVVLTRFPDGIEGKSFYQKDAPGFAPAWVRTQRIWTQGGGGPFGGRGGAAEAPREIDYFVCDDVDTLVFLANLGTIPLHIWSSRCDTLQSPDWCIVDLDPKGAPFAHVIEVARAVRRLCEEIGLPSLAKTSGSTGLHVLVPLGRRCTYAQSRALGELIARVVVGEMPDVATIERAISARGGRVYLDYLQNVHGQLIAAPFSVRPLPGAPVSMPLRWDEVGPGLDPRGHTIRTALARMERLGEDPLLPVLDLAPDLVGALERLGAKLLSRGA